MHDLANGLRRILLLRGWVNKGTKKGRGDDPRPFRAANPSFLQLSGLELGSLPVSLGYGSRSPLAPGALVGMVVGDLAVVERHREGGEQAAALDGEAGSGTQGVADHAGVLQRQAGWLLEEEPIIPDAAAAGEALG